MDQKNTDINPTYTCAKFHLGILEISRKVSNHTYWGTETSWDVSHLGNSGIFVFNWKVIALTRKPQNHFILSDLKCLKTRALLQQISPKTALESQRLNVNGMGTYILVNFGKFPRFTSSTLGTRALLDT